MWWEGRGGGAPAYLRADVARAVAERAYEASLPVELVSLDDVGGRQPGVHQRRPVGGVDWSAVARSPRAVREVEHR